MIGIKFAGKFEWIVPYGLAFAAGAMLFVVYKEIIPESHGDGNERAATFSFIVGLISMIGLTQWIR
jgi:ZIP family zinc transporter